ncbi:hypothetical protein TSOC_006500 [Tetrabaena socialis]|uniref:Uncharacterized protein n=1 Tax=Tetrabaena socialis TaxID=47790 RepID=A0A2J8A3I4_9CHLO|nr:hypothetical protein TSOC_006500 [Tetrabaena socialis]|eukprot:PNH07080.1 hypothetical protein TSOC_006500 [Tetrabaena socialis]
MSIRRPDLHQQRHIAVATTTLRGAAQARHAAGAGREPGKQLGVGSQEARPPASGEQGEARLGPGGKVAYKASSGDPVELLSLWDPYPGTKVAIAFFTHFADLSSWDNASGRPVHLDSDP